ncbi:MAG TPA: class I SAM-dependent methyltransferase [bacterium]|nr:class I SAM-dependent methyltransferase [bacterium]
MSKPPNPGEIPEAKENNHDGWWREWFNHIYLDVYAHRDEIQAAEEVRATLAVLPVGPESRILDLCCGNGRHCRALRRAGYRRVVGVDYSFPLLKHAMAESPRGNYVRADMRLLPLATAGIDAVFSFFTSFGYFQTNVENLAVLHEIARVLRPEGHFMLDYLNPAYVRETLVAESVKAHGDYIIREKRCLSPDGDRIEKEIVIENWGVRDHRYHESVQLYEHDTMLHMLESADLQVDGTFGDFDATPFLSHSPRMILYGRRK